MNSTDTQPPDFSSLVQILQHHAQHQPDKVAFQFLENGAEQGASLTYGQLALKAQVIAQALQPDHRPGDRVLLLYPAGLAFLEAFLGCLWAGLVPIPAPAPDAVQFKRAWPRLKAVLEDAQASIILTTSDLVPRLQDLLQANQMSGKKTVATDRLLEGPQVPSCPAPPCRPDDLAYLQYTSGSTSDPKGVMISQGALVAQLADLKTAYSFEDANRSLNWMPHHHDYGLVQGLLLPLFAGGQGYIMSPTSFLRNPSRWLQAISKYKISHSQVTNFALAYCLRKTTLDEMPTLDLAGWKAASIGAEAINPEVTRRFVQTFLAKGFRPGALLPGYGLAETTLVATTKRPGAGVTYGAFGANALRAGKVVETGNQAQVTVVGCGSLIGKDNNLRIVDPESHRPCAENEIGEIWLKNSSLALGYWQRPEETNAVFRAHLQGNHDEAFLRTGDMGFVWNGELFVTGRRKDLIIVRGQNHYPKDIEFAVEACHPNIKSGRCAAFSVGGVESEKLVVVAEYAGEKSDKAYKAAVSAITAAVTQASELVPAAIVLIVSGSLPVTSSGKIQRPACRTLFSQEKLDSLYCHKQQGGDLPLQPASQAPKKQRDHLAALLLKPADVPSDQHLISYLLMVLEDVLGVVDLGWVTEDLDLLELGIDSAMSVEFRTFVEEELELQLPSDLLFEHPTLRRLSDFLLPRILENKKAQEPSGLSIKEDLETAHTATTPPTPDLQAGKARLLDWRVEQADQEYDVTSEDLEAANRLSLPLTKLTMRKRGAAVITDSWKPAKPIIDRDSKVLGLGSCFTRDIILWLAECGFNRQFPGSAYEALLRYPAIGNNAYLARQFELLEKGSKVTEAPEQIFTNRFLDAEKGEGEKLFRLLETLDVLVLTLGTNETWCDGRTGALLKAPMLLAEYNPEWHKLTVDGFAETLQHLETIDRVIESNFPKLEVIYTLPVGRMATFAPVDCFSATSRLDATLKCALAEFLEARSDNPRRHYFPAFELVYQFYTEPFRADNVHVSSYVTGRLCASFADMFCAEATLNPASNSLEGFDTYYAQVISSSLADEDRSGDDPVAKAKIASLEAEVSALQQVCDERMTVIEVLDKAVKEFQKKEN